LSYKLSYTRHDGQKLTLGIHGIPVSWDNKPAVFALVEDLTDLELSQQKIESYILQLKHIYKGTLIAISNMVEKRDPYTAGHQRRVGLIAKQIAAEMGLPPEKGEILEMIGLVHDIGKISIPVEILTKPTKLTEYEMGMIKQHPQFGYDILKHVDFNFPVAEVILQHHERLDGSGYPRQLSGEQILPETRIISVADVFEAISAFRPYRAALGLDVAVDELKKGKGKIYDAKVVDCLLKLIKEDRLKTE
jgi:HD-GYP domain-containing protein (c-di-GMP phosphodiesterase class II)